MIYYRITIRLFHFFSNSKSVCLLIPISFIFSGLLTIIFLFFSHISIIFNRIRGLFFFPIYVFNYFIFFIKFKSSIFSINQRLTE
jgi:hypothetical protein